MEIELTKPDGTKFKIESDTMIKRTAKAGGISQYRLKNGLRVEAMEDWRAVTLLVYKGRDEEQPRKVSFQDDARENGMPTDD